MKPPAPLGLLILAVGGAMPLPPLLVAPARVAETLVPIAVLAQPDRGPTAMTTCCPKLRIRHAAAAAAFDKSNRSWQGRTIPWSTFSHEGYHPGTPLLVTAGFWAALLGFTLQRGWSVSATVARLLEQSRKAQENGERYALRTAQRAAEAVVRPRGLQPVPRFPLSQNLHYPPPVFLLLTQLPLPGSFPLVVASLDRALWPRPNCRRLNLRRR
jgi:hypothetical protein